MSSYSEMKKDAKKAAGLLATYGTIKLIDEVAESQRNMTPEQINHREVHYPQFDYVCMAFYVALAAFMGGLMHTYSFKVWETGLGEGTVMWSWIIFSIIVLLNGGFSTIKLMLSDWCDTSARFRFLLWQLVASYGQVWCFFGLPMLFWS